MTISPEKARNLLNKLELLNKNLDLLTENLKETIKRLPDDASSLEAKQKAEAALHDLQKRFGKEFIKKSFW